MTDSYAVNRANWDERAPAHAASPDYAVSRFADDPEHLSDTVRFDLPRLGDLAGLDGLHLQCHIGTDTVSLARLGARMTGLDFSSASIAEARRVAAVAGADVRFVEAEAYAAVDELGAGAFDLVYTGIGAICWLPDIARWGRLIADLLRPGGRFFMREGHPVLWSLDEQRTDALMIRYPYFERPEPDVWDEEGTYVQTDTQFSANVSHTWSHGLGEIVMALLDAGLELTQLVEHDSVPWEALPGQMERLPGSEFRIVDRPWRLPHTYTIQARKR